MVVEAIEELFHPVLVHNNRPGPDAQLLKRFNEPAWNNPVVRYLDADENDLIQREDGVWTTTDTVKRMVAALSAAKRKVPGYLVAMTTSSPIQSQQTATFAMHCYWEGEAKLGAIKGVHATRSGWVGPLEVVMLRYDPAQVDYARLVETAQSFDCASKVYAHSDAQMKLAEARVGEDAVRLKSADLIRDAKDSDQKYYLLQTPLHHLPLSETQATKINAALKSNLPIKSWLSPRQIKLYQRVLTAVKRDKDSLKSFHYPRRIEDLASYSTRLSRRLDELEQSGME